MFFVLSSLKLRFHFQPTKHQKPRLVCPREQNENFLLATQWGDLVQESCSQLVMLRDAETEIETCGSSR